MGSLCRRMDYVRSDLVPDQISPKAPERRERDLPRIGQSIV